MSQQNITITFDKSGYNLGETANVTISNLTAGKVLSAYLTTEQGERITLIDSIPIAQTTITLPFTVTYIWLSSKYFLVEERELDGSILRSLSVVLPLIVYQPYAPISTRETLRTDKTTYRIGENIIWTASNLTTQTRYRVSICFRDTCLWAPSRDEWVADTSTKTGAFLVGDNIPPGSVVFKLEKQVSSYVWNVVDSVNLMISAGAPPPPPPPSGDWLTNIINWIKSNIWLVLILGVVAILLFSKK